MIFIITLFILVGIIYFISMVGIQFKYLSNINLKMGMDITKLYPDDDESIIKRCAMSLYKLSHNLK